MVTWVQKYNDFSSLEGLMNQMQGILHVDGIQPLLLQILSLSDEKEQIARFRKILEESRKKNTEKGVPVHLSNVK